MKGPTGPTPGIERMHPKMARAHFKARWEKLLKDSSELPPAEQFRLAADLIERGLYGQGRAIAQQALAALPKP